MKHLAAYLLLKLNNPSPTKEDVSALLETVGIVAIPSRLDHLFSALEGRDLNDVYPIWLLSDSSCFSKVLGECLTSIQEVGLGNKRRSRMRKKMSPWDIWALWTYSSLLSLLIIVIGKLLDLSLLESDVRECISQALNNR